MRKNSKKQTRTVTHDHPGRPKYDLKWPTREEWTFQDLLETNGVETNPDSKNYGKGEKCSLLTVRKNLKRDMYILNPKTGKVKRVNPRSKAVLVKGVTAEPNSTTGLGRRAKVYCLRVNKGSVSKPAPKAVKAVAPKAPRKARTVKTPGDATSAATKTYEAIKDILAQPTPAPASVPAASAPVAEPVPAAVTVPAVTIAPDPAPAPVAPESANAEAATPVAQPVTPTLANS